MQAKKFNGLDHLRALAIILVMFYHYQLGVFGHPEWSTWFDRIAWTGVDLFFVLSGFLISSQLFTQLKEGKAISIKTFYIKRFFRIIPLYLVVVGIYFFIPFFREKEALPQAWRFLTFTQNFGLDLWHNGTFSHAWSLCVEEHFYLLLPLTLLVLQYFKLFKRTWLLLIILFLLGFVVRTYSWHQFELASESGVPGAYWPKYVYYPTYNRMDGLLFGVSIAAIYTFLPKLWTKLSAFGNYYIITGVLILTAAWFFCATLGQHPVSIYGFAVVALGYGFLVLGAVCPTSFLFKWNSKATTFIATLSYAIYLSHKGIIHITQKLFSDWDVDVNGNLMMVFCFVACVIAALVLHWIIEKPFMKLRTRITG